jgi:hypothetical protein
MARLARRVIAGMPRHATLRGNRRQGLLNSAVPEKALKELRGHGRTGRPLGDEAFLERWEGLVGRALKARKGGRPGTQRNQ